MVNKYKQKSDRQTWRQEDMQNAIDAVNSGEMGWLRASKDFNVPQATLRRQTKTKSS